MQSWEYSLNGYICRKLYPIRECEWDFFLNPQKKLIVSPQMINHSDRGEKNRARRGICLSFFVDEFITSHQGMFADQYMPFYFKREIIEEHFHDPGL